MTTPDYSRRDFIKTALAAGAVAPLASCGKPQPNNTDKPMQNAALRNLRDLANKDGLYFVDSSGQTASLDAVQAAIGKNYSTMSFMFAACGDICPLTASALSAVSEKNPQLKHVVVSVDSYGDFANGNLVNKLKAQGLRTDGPNKNTFVLYPSLDGTATPKALIGANTAGATLEHNLNLITRGNAPEGHSGMISLFDGAGNLQAQVSNPQLEGGIKKMIDGLSAPLQNAPSR